MTTVARELLGKPAAPSIGLLRRLKTSRAPAISPRPSSISPNVLDDTPTQKDLKKSLAKLRRIVSFGDWRATTPLAYAHKILDDDRSVRHLDYSKPGPSKGATVRCSRSWIYTQLIHALRLQSDGRLDAIYSILSRQISERIPMSSKTLTTILKLAVDSQDPTDTLPIIQKVLPILPESMDLHLLTLVVSALIKSAKPTPAEVEKLLTECLASQGVQQFEDWPVGMYDLLIQSHRGDFRGGVELLGRLRPILQKRKMSDGWTIDDTEAMAMPYITLMDIWIETQVNGKRSSHSEVPSRLADALFELLDQSSPPREFINVWTNAECITGNRISVLNNWLKYFGDHSPSSAPNTQHILEPNSKSFEVLWKSFKVAKKPLPHLLVGRFLGSKSVSTDSLNAALSASFAFRKPDRPLIHILLSAFKGEILPNARTIDLISAGLIRIWRQTSTRVHERSGEDKSEGELKRIRAHRRRLVESSRNLPSSASITLREWDLISNEILRLRTDKEAALVLLPLGRPLARLQATQHPSSSDHTVTTSAAASPISLKLPLNLIRPGDKGKDVRIRISIPAPEVSRKEGKNILRALLQLLESSMIERYRHDPTWDTSDNKRSLRKLLKETRADVFTSQSLAHHQ